MFITVKIFYSVSAYDRLDLSSWIISACKHQVYFDFNLEVVEFKLNITCLIVYRIFTSVRFTQCLVDIPEHRRHFSLHRRNFFRHCFISGRVIGSFIWRRHNCRRRASKFRPVDARVLGSFCIFHAAVMPHPLCQVITAFQISAH